MRLHQRYEVYSAKLSGRESQSDGPVTEKTCGPNRLSRYRGTIKRRRVADWRCCRAETSDRGTQRSARYCGDWPCKQLYIATPSLYWTLSGTSSQSCQRSSECRSRDKPRSYLWVLDSTRAAAFSNQYPLQPVSDHFRRTVGGGEIGLEAAHECRDFIQCPHIIVTLQELASSSTERYYVLSYVAFIVSAVVLCVIIALATELLGLAAARNLYVSMLRNVVSAPMRWEMCNGGQKTRLILITLLVSLGLRTGPVLQSVIIIIIQNL